MPQIFIETLGCKINQNESSCIIDDFRQSGYTLADTPENADIIIINTCSVTNRADYRSRYLLNKAQKIKSKRPNTKIIVTGCYAQKNEAELSKTGFFDFIVDNNSKNKILEYLTKNKSIFTEATQFDSFADHSMSIMTGRNRAILKIQDGCDFDCAYCIVPSVRGKPRDRSVKSIHCEVTKLLQNGYEEIILSGINLGLFSGLPALLIRLNKYKGIKHIRLGSLEPQLFTPTLLKSILSVSKICPHFHIPLQSGSDALLTLHRRRYTTADFQNLIYSLHQIRLHPAIGLDVIVGLPGETDELFEQTFAFLQSLPITYLHVFTYSKRKGTLAAEMKDQVHGTVAKERSKRLLELSEQKKRQYITLLIEKQIPLFVSPEGYDKGLYHGTSDRYVKAYFSKQNSQIFIAKDYYKDGVEVVGIAPHSRRE
ncbi:MAG: tRNA (N(6)-L-threonylcarbamoyladenosine(37)-C(2))-methylthiotransferase MtaB [Candidatus Cloacimonetes bacterium]|nr:tRNA (N(6)-L-threonylcarbamoyladenosine(37)-C(2))-methylthiotransferase MtaB [Candidatus Cloacimonadota bacterium]